MTLIESLITDHLELWSSAVRAKSSAGRGSNSKLELTGIKKLRELILELAVRGKLVPQDPDDEPASVLLERIKAEKARLVKEGKIKKAKPLPEITDEEKPFELPEGWEWCRLGCLSNINGGFAFKSNNYKDEGVRVVRISDFDENGFKFDNIVRHDYTDSLSQFQLELDDILMAMTGGTVGKSYLVKELPEPMVVNQRVAKINLFDGVTPEFVNALINSLSVRVVIDNAKNSTNDNISMGDITGFYVPLPPLPEQLRIVYKLNELMSLCDQLEQQSEASLAAHQTLVETLLATLTDSADSSELAQNWARLAQHFDSLFTTQSSIDALKQTILQLAVMGKLVPQDPNDEPASVLLERIAAEKARLIKEGKIKKEKPLPPISEEEKPFALPDGWEWCRFGYIVILKSGCTFGKDRELEEGTIYCKVSDMNLEDNLVEINTSSRFIQHSNEESTALIPCASIIFPKRGGAIATNKKRYVKSEIFVDPNIMAVTPFSLVELKYVMTWLDSFDMAKLNSGTSVPQINNKDIDPLLFPLPPLREQYHIVSKVDDLMSLCDQLSARLQASQTTQLQLAEALVEGALN